MADILQNPIEGIWQRFQDELVAKEVIATSQMSFGNSDVGARLPWIAFKPMTNYTWLQALDLCNNENGILVNIQVECFASKESQAMALEDECKAVMFGMGFYATGYAQRFKNNNVHRYISRYALSYTGELFQA